MGCVISYNKAKENKYIKKNNQQINKNQQEEENENEEEEEEEEEEFDDDSSFCEQTVNSREYVVQEDNERMEIVINQFLKQQEEFTIMNANQGQNSSQVKYYVNLKTKSLFAQKKLYKIELYQKEKEKYLNIKKTFQNDLNILQSYAILMEKFNDEEQILQYNLGICSLSDFIKFRASKGIEWSVQELKYIFKRLLKFVLIFYKKGKYFHGDIKPGNIVLTKKGKSEFNKLELKIIDFAGASDDYSYYPMITYQYFNRQTNNNAQSASLSQSIFKNEHQRFQREIYTIVRTFQKIAVESCPSNPKLKQLFNFPDKQILQQTESQLQKLMVEIKKTVFKNQYEQDLGFQKMLDFIQYSLIPEKFTITDIAQFIQKKSIFPDHSQQYINDKELICQDIINFQIDNQGYKQNDPLENLFQIQTYIENIQCSFTDNPYQKLNTTFQVPEKTNYQTYLSSSPYKILENKTQIKMLQTLPSSQYQFFQVDIKMSQPIQYECRFKIISLKENSQIFFGLCQKQDKQPIFKLDLKQNKCNFKELQVFGKNGQQLFYQEKTPIELESQGKNISKNVSQNIFKDFTILEGDILIINIDLQLKHIYFSKKNDPSQQFQSPLNICFNYFQNLNLENSEKIYQPCCVLQQESDHVEFMGCTQIQKQDLRAEFNLFLKDLNYQVFLLLGDSGTGKSSFLLYLKAQLDNCLFLNLANIRSIQQLQDTISKIYQTSCQRIIFLFDGLEELKLQQQINLFQVCKLQENPLSKLIITSRKEVIENNFIDQYFSNFAEQNHCIRYMCEFNDQQIKEFTTKFVQKIQENQVYFRMKSYKNVIDYLKKFQQFPELKKMLQNPLFLRITLEVLPKIEEKFEKQKENLLIQRDLELILLQQKIYSKYSLYNEFLTSWIGRKLQKCTQEQLNQLTLKQLQAKKMGDSYTQDSIISKKNRKSFLIQGYWTQLVEEFNMILSFLMFKKETLIINWEQIIQNSHLFQLNQQVNEQFFEQFTQLSPLKSQDKHSIIFTHKSFQEFYLSKYFLKLIDQQKKIRPQNQTIQQLIESKISHPLNQKLLEKRHLNKLFIIKQYIKFCQQHEKNDILEKLIFLIKLSDKRNGQIAQKIQILSANCSTLMCFLGYPFSSLDFQYIQIPFASLQEGIFCNTNFSNSILQGVDFSNSLLRETNFSNCDLKDIVLGKYLDLNGHLKPINCLAQTNINALNYGQIQLLASGSQDKTIIIWNPHTNTQYQKIKTSSYCKSLLFIKQGLYLIAGFQSGDLIFYKLQISRQNIQNQESNQEQKLPNQKIDSYQIKYLKIFKEVQAHEDTVSSIQYSDLNSFLITCSHDVSVKIWNLQEPKYTNQQQQQNGQNLIQYNNQKGNLRDYANIQPQISTIQLYQILRNHENYINQICFKQPYLASCSDDQQVIIYRLNEINIQSSQQKNIIFQLEQRMKNFKSGVLCIDISKDLKFLAAGTRDQCIYIKYILNGQNFFVKKQKDQIDNILDGVQSVKFIFDSQYIITGNSSSFIQIWNCNQQTLNQQIEGHTKGITSIQVSENNQFFFSASRDSSIKIFNSNENINFLSGQQERPRDLNSNKEQATQIKFLFDSKFLIQVFNDSKLRIYSLETSDFVKSVDTQQYCIKQIDLSQDEALLASIGIKNQYIKIYETSTFDQLKSFQGHTSQINQVSFSPDSKVVASCSNDGTVRIWNIKQNAHQNFGNSTPQLQIKKMLPQHQYKFKAQKHILLDDHNKKQVNFVKFSTQGSQQYLASSGFDNTINLYSVLDNYQKFTLIRKLKLHKDWVTSLQFSPIDEKILISGDLLGNLYQWNININEITKIQCEVIQEQNQENANQIAQIEFSACGNYFFYITNKSEIRIRTINQKNANNKTGTQFLGGQQFPLCLTVSKDKRFLAVGSYLDSIKIWNIEEQDHLYIIKSLGKKLKFNNFQVILNNSYNLSELNRKIFLQEDVQTIKN